MKTATEYFQNAIAVDIETTVEAFQQLRVITVDKQVFKVYPTELKIDSLLNDKLWIGAGMAYFDMPILQRNGYEPSGIWDILICEQHLAGGNVKGMPSYASLVEKYCGVKLDKDLQTSDWSEDLTPEQIEYCLNDTKYLLEIAKKQYEAIVQFGMLPHIELFHQTALVWFKDVTDGFPVDEEKRKELYTLCDVEYMQKLIELTADLPVKILIKSNPTLVGINKFAEKVKPYNASIVHVKRKVDLDTFDFECFREYLTVTADFDEDLFISPEAGAFCPKLAAHYGVCSEDGFGAAILDKFIESNPNHPVTHKFKLILDLRHLSKIRDTYCTRNEDRIGTVNGENRAKPRFATTVTGRLTFSPLSQLPKPEELEDDSISFRNKLQEMYVPPKGYTILALDYSSEEDVVSGLLYRDSFKIRSIKEGFDPYLLLASRVFKFDYSSPDQTKQLKKDKKVLRQAMKAACLARNFGASTFKLDSMLEVICKDNNIKRVTGQTFVDAWNSIYPDIADALDNIRGNIVNALEEIGGYVDGARSQAGSVSRTLKEERALISVGNVFGLQDIQTAESVSKYVRVPKYINHPVQSSSACVLLLAVQLVKKAYPSIVIPVTVHDSLVCFVPESGIIDKDGNLINLDEIKSSVISLMKLAFYIIFGSSIDIDASYCKHGIKG